MQLREDSKRISLFLPSLEGGGAQRVSLTLAIGLARRGYDVDLVLAKAKGPYMDMVPSSIRIIDLAVDRVAYAVPGLARYLRKTRPGILISTMNYVNIIAVWATFLSPGRTRLVLTEHSTLSIAKKQRKTLIARMMPSLMSLFYPRADAVIAVSHGVRDDLIREISLPDEFVHVVYNPVITDDLFKKADEPLDHPWFAHGEPPVIIAVGRLTKEKDFATLITAFAKLRHHMSARLMILGEGDERNELQNLCRQLGVTVDVALPGFVPNPYSYMKHSKVLVLSSRREGLPTVLIEAMACGLDVISTDCPSGPREILEDGKLGHLLPVGDPNAMALALRECLSKESESPRPDGGLERFSLDTSVSKYLAVATSSNH